MLSKSIPKLYEDSSFVVFNKPSGLIVIPSPRKETRTLVSLVNEQERTESQQPRLHPCHRLDRDTSGTILFAKGKKNQKIMMDAFRDKQVEKKYLALVNGRMNQEEGTFNAPVLSHDKAKRRVAAVPQSAKTNFRVIHKYRDFTEVEIELITGRSNQIRIHFSKAGYPLIGERKYAIAKKYPYKFRRVALHAFSLQWLHPLTKKNIIVKSKMPKDMLEFIRTSAQ